MARRKYVGDNYLRYMTKRDARVRHEHAILDGAVKHVDDPFWDIYTPPNGWGCRCTLDKMSGSGITSTNTIGLNLHKSVPSIFLFNAGKTQTVVSKKHPYFKSAKKKKKLAKVNFKLPIPKK
jgi:uncharacterized protein with gpF-like domain